MNPEDRYAYHGRLPGGIGRQKASSLYHELAIILLTLSALDIKLLTGPWGNLQDLSKQIILLLPYLQKSIVA